jgi:hypothetical protein
MRAELRRHNEETPIQRVKIIMERDLGILKWYERCQKRNGIANEKYTSSSLPFGSVSSGSTLHFARRRFGARKPTLVNFGDQASGRNQRNSLDKLHPHLRLNLQSLVPNTIPGYSVSPPSSFPPHITFTSCPQLQLPARLQQPKPSQQTRMPSPRRMQSQRLHWRRMMNSRTSQ